MPYIQDWCECAQAGLNIVISPDRNLGGYFPKMTIDQAFMNPFCISHTIGIWSAKPVLTWSPDFRIT